MRKKLPVVKLLAYTYLNQFDIFGLLVHVKRVYESGSMTTIGLEYPI